MVNRLSASTSPYLRQHAGNPVDWFEWGEEAFAAARDRGVPVLLSVGYSACHWCHVMAHESFEDPATAVLMNRLFVSVKVDREERPDVDSVYMEAVQAMAGQGGWPMTVWLTPDGRPFHAGTYFPSTDRAGMPSFTRVMEAVSEAWISRRDQVTSQADRLTEAISQTLPPAAELPGPGVVKTAYSGLERQFDPINGGFGGAPKFPQPPLLELLLRTRSEPWAARADQMLGHTLTRMAQGGIYDQIGGGFARYSVDERWLVPHFEKMLYDNAQLARIYLWAWRELGVESFRVIAEETLDYLRRDLRHPDGGFFSAEDADSEGEEGRFYVWSLAELLEVAGPDDGPIAAAHWGASEDGNFEGANILSVVRTTAQLADRLGRQPAEIADAIERARQRLMTARSRRVRPGLDHKVIAAWNGLALRALAEAGEVLGRLDLIDAAIACARFVLDRMRTEEGGLYRIRTEEKSSVPGFLEDYAGMAVGLFALYQVTGQVEWYRAAEELTRAIPEWFSDPDGGFFTTAVGAERLIKRPKDPMDNPYPSGGSLAAEALLMLSLYTGEPELRRQAEGAIRAGGTIAERYPTAVGHLVSVLHTLHRGPCELAVVGPDAGDLSAVAWERFRPGLVMAVDQTGGAAELVPLLAERWREGETLAYLCENFACAAPTADPNRLRELLESTEPDHI